MKHRFIGNAWFLLAWICLAPPILAGEVPENPLGEDFQINTYTSSYQIWPEVGLQPDGFVVVWASEGSSQSDNDSFSIQAQRYGADGLPMGGEFQINTYTTGRQVYPAVAVAPTGDFVVVWQSAGSSADDNQGTSIQGQRFTSDGFPLGGEFQVNTYTSANQRYPEVGIDASGLFVVVWEQGCGEGIRGQKFFSDGMPSGPEVDVTSSGGDFRRPDVAMTQDGAWVVVWVEYDQQTQAGNIDYNVFLPDSFAENPTVTSPEVTAEVGASSIARNAKVDTDADGHFVVVWGGYCASGPDPGEGCLRGRRFSSIGLPISDEFQINTYTTLQQMLPDVAVEPDGDFTVVWTSESSGDDDTSETSIQGRRFDASGVPRGEDFQVNSMTADFQLYPAIEIDVRGDFVVVWHSLTSAGSDTDHFSVQGRRFAPSKVGLLFEDGFESGDTSAWSVP